MFRTLLSCAFAALFAPIVGAQNLINPFGWSIDNGETAASVTTTATSIQFRPLITSGAARPISFSQPVPVFPAGVHQFSAEVVVPANASTSGFKTWAAGTVLVQAQANIQFGSASTTLPLGSTFVSFTAPSTTNPNVVYTLPQPKLERVQQVGAQVAVNITARQFALTAVGYTATGNAPLLIIGSASTSPISFPPLTHGLEVDPLQPYATASSPVSALVPWGTLAPLFVQAVDTVGFSAVTQHPAY